jgi:uncharacterized protein Veg
MCFGASKRVSGSKNPKRISGTIKIHLGTIINMKCISGRSRQLPKSKLLPNAFRCVQIHLVTSQMDFHSAPPRLMHFVSNEMHFAMAQYVIRFQAAVVNAINWLKFANDTNTML